MTPGGAPLPLSFDVEEFSDLSHLGIEMDGGDPSLPRQIDATLALIDEIGARATFFVLGRTAQRFPEAIRSIAAQGHEIGSHGHSHEPVNRMTPAQFRLDLERSIELIGELSGRAPRGFRAPLFSIGPESGWALELLAELGFDYDSSQVAVEPSADDGPGVRVDRVELASGRAIWEIPLPVWRLGPLSIPIGGGSYWRLLPAAVLRRGIDRQLARDATVALYFHPYELDPERLRVVLPSAPGRRERTVAIRTNLLYNPGRRAVARRIRAIARSHPLIGYEEALMATRAMRAETGAQA